MDDFKLILIAAISGGLLGCCLGAFYGAASVMIFPPHDVLFVVNNYKVLWHSLIDVRGPELFFTRYIEYDVMWGVNIQKQLYMYFNIYPRYEHQIYTLWWHKTFYPIIYNRPMNLGSTFTPEFVDFFYSYHLFTLQSLGV
jgi:hypothetical protein